MNIEPAPFLNGDELMITTREEWMVHVESKPSVRPELPRMAAFQAMSDIERRRLNRARVAHNNSFGPIDTAALKRVRKRGFELMELNRYAGPAARLGLLIDGDAALGKSTALLDFGKRYELLVRSKIPSGLTKSGDDLIPVVYITLGDTTIKGLNKAILNYLGLPAGGSTDDMTLLIQKAARQCAIKLILIDDFHHLEARYREHRRLNNHLKHLGSTVAATFVYAGIDCERGGLLDGNKGGTFRSTERRFTLEPIQPYARNGKAKKAWLDDLTGIESQLALLRAKPRDLVKIEDYLFDRTGGVMGSLLQLIRLGASRAIRNGDERITKPLLEGVKINLGGERRGAA